MERETVKSSNILSIGPTRDEVEENGYQGITEIEFSSGDVWQYQVPESRWRGLMDSPSKGKYFNANIRKSHPGKKVS